MAAIPVNLAAVALIAQGVCVRTAMIYQAVVYPYPLKGEGGPGKWWLLNLLYLLERGTS